MVKKRFSIILFFWGGGGGGGWGGGGRGQGGGKEASLRSVEFGTQSKGYQIEKKVVTFFNKEPGTCSTA